jgi:hypothetical protein
MDIFIYAVLGLIALSSSVVAVLFIQLYQAERKWRTEDQNKAMALGMCFTAACVSEQFRTSLQAQCNSLLNKIGLVQDGRTSGRLVGEFVMDHVNMELFDKAIETILGAAEIYAHDQKLREVNDRG